MFFLMKPKNSLNDLSYELLFEKLETLREAAEKEGHELTRNELDHIIWYCYKSFKAN